MRQTETDHTRIPAPGGKDEGFRAPEELYSHSLPYLPEESIWLTYEPAPQPDLSWLEVAYVFGPYIAILAFTALCAFLVWVLAVTG
jgi:hypothetical protein